MKNFIKALPFAIKNLLVNKVFMIVTFAFCFEITIISGFITFLPKYIEHQFSVNDSMANIYTGGVAIPGACVGIVAGGFIVKKFKIDIRGASLMAICCNVICLIGIGFLVFLGCPNIKMAGTTMHYTSNE
jgi:prolipoprotein diacylglyceryltransferase